MNHAVLCVEVASAETVTCKIVVIPDEMLLPVAPAGLYTQPQLDALLIGRAWLPTLDALPGQPSITQIAAAIPVSIPTGSTLPLETVLKAQSANFWTANAIFFLTEAEIVPMCNPSETSPALATAWGMAATITFSTGSGARGIFNPDDYESPVPVTETTDLYFPKPDKFIRTQFEIMRDDASSAGAYWYRSYALLRPSYLYLYQTPGSPFLNHPPPPHPFLTITTDARGVILSDSAFMYWNEAYQVWGRIDAYSSKWYNTLLSGSGFKQVPVGLSGIAGKVVSVAPGHWMSFDVPARVRRKKQRKAGIAPIVGSLLLLSALFMGASSPAPARRRRTA